jgi:hypothetical protein
LEERGEGGKHFFLKPRIFLQGKGEGAFWDPEKKKDPKEKKRIKSDKNKKCISITVTGLLLKR